MEGRLSLFLFGRRAKGAQAKLVSVCVAQPFAMSKCCARVEEWHKAELVSTSVWVRRELTRDPSPVEFKSCLLFGFQLDCFDEVHE